MGKRSIKTKRKLKLKRREKKNAAPVATQKDTKRRVEDES
tara:strand:- start:125 stop:244 length:120 start_codon:yes stop_codon:yes gene_type:complete